MIAEIEHSGIRVDENGDWFYNGSKIFRPEILESFYEKLVLSAEGEYFLADSKGRWQIEVADTPFVVTRVDVQRAVSGQEQIMLRLKNISCPETLDPSTLKTGKDNVLYCTTAAGKFPARFSRPAYYQLADFLGEDETGSGFFIQLNGKRYPITEETAPASHLR
ncbi:MAG: DUF1285 domain-containing protein [Syntrophobacteraceae bacterium]